MVKGNTDHLQNAFDPVTEDTVISVGSLASGFYFILIIT